MTTPKPTRPSRARKPKAEANVERQAMIDAEAAKLKAQLEPGVTISDLKSKLDHTAGIRSRIAAEVDRLSGELAAMNRNLIGCDGALQVLGELIEAVETKRKVEEA